MYSEMPLENASHFGIDNILFKLYLNNVEYVSLTLKEMKEYRFFLWEKRSNNVNLTNIV